MPVTTIISDIAGVLLLKDPNWDEITKWNVHLGLQTGSLMQALYHPDLDEAALLGHISQEELFQQVSATFSLCRDQLHEFEAAFWSQYQLNDENPVILPLTYPILNQFSNCPEFFSAFSKSRSIS